ncbi:MAG: hypothetical protein KF861_17100, partial [Planctomycetaceae bacterium]|nr:hypothetical protein [Planctomycetaceae bacterium]
VLGLPSNLDQHLTMADVERIGAGLTLRAETATEGAILASTLPLVETSKFRQAAHDAARLFQSYDCQERFRQLVDRVIGAEPAEHRARPQPLK